MAIKVGKSEDEKFTPLLQRIKERVKNMSRKDDRGIVNTKAKSSVSLRKNGDVNIVSSKFAQKKLSADGKTQDIAYQSVDITNTKKVTVDELIINNHKFNNKLFEYTDPMAVFGNEHKVVTDLNMQATVLTKSWEPTLQRYVMIRRPARFAVFSPELNVAQAPEGLGIDTQMQSQFEETLTIEKQADTFESFKSTT